MTGKIKTLTYRGFGFIEPQGFSARGTGVFFDRSVVVGFNFDNLEVGQTVEYQVGPDPRDLRRMQATRVEVMGT
jgi:cold shock CspA family protein